ncbi:MAG: hypothetical protein LBJ31_11940 [Treponema sp.]|nr:hypothetical protein [Treponema sp.]
MAGVEKPVPSNKIGEYVNYEFWHYYHFYTKCKSAGPPLPYGWLDWPVWIVQLMTHFDAVLKSKQRREDSEFQAALHGAKLR